MGNSVFDFFSRLEKEKWSGEVDVSATQGHATILIQDGQFLWAARPIDRAVDRYQKISWIKLPDPQIIFNAKTWEGFLNYLIPLNQENYARLVRLLKTERVELFYRIFFWTNLELVPRPFEVKTPDQAVLGFYSYRKISALLIEAKRRVDEWPKIQEKIGSSRRIFVSQISLPAASQKEVDAVEKSLLEFDENPAHTGRHILPSVPFNLQELEIIRNCDGTNSVEDLIRLSTDGEFLVLRRLVDLWRKGAVRPRDDDEPIVPSRFRASKPGLGDFIGAIWSASVFSLFFALSSILKVPGEAPRDVPVKILQALDIDRNAEGRYPFNLQALVDAGLLSSQEAFSCQYRLLQPFQFEIRAKSQFPELKQDSSSKE